MTTTCINNRINGCDFSVLILVSPINLTFFAVAFQLIVLKIITRDCTLYFASNSWVCPILRIFFKSNNSVKFSTHFWQKSRLLLHLNNTGDIQETILIFRKKHNARLAILRCFETKKIFHYSQIHISPRIYRGVPYTQISPFFTLMAVVWYSKSLFWNCTGNSFLKSD